MKNIKKMRRAAAVLLTTAVLLSLLAGCGPKNDVKSTISEFESACQSLDVKRMLACVNPTVAKPILDALNLFGVEDTSGTLEQIVGVLDLFDDAGQVTEELVQSIQIKPSNYAFNDAKDKCTVTADLSYGDGDSKIITLQMILKDGSWYISDIDF